jgi:cytochrome c-type biogenesis protein CcmH
MLAFWIAASLLSAAAVMVVLARAARPPRPAGEAPELAVYRRHLAELEAQRAQGLLDDEGYAAAEAEAGRRLLAANLRAASAAPAPRDTRRDRTVVLAAIVATVLIGAGVYLTVGTPGMPDEPYAKRLKAWLGRDPATLQPAQLAAILKKIAVKRPRDPQVWRFLGHAYADANDPADAAEAYERAVALDPNSAAAWSGLGVAVVGLNEGQVSAEAQQDFAEALKRDPALVPPRYFLAQAAIESGHRDEGLAAWKALAASLPANDPRRQVLDQQIATLEGGGAAASIATAAPADQLEMIRGMVAGLAARLKDHPDDPDGWARLVKSYGVLGDAKAKAGALARARALFRNRPQDLAKIEAAAR